MPTFKFRVGDVFPADDPLAAWAANLSMAFNDLVFANDRMDKSDESWERFHWSRLAWAHLSEVMRFLRAHESDREVAAFVQSLPENAQDAYRHALDLYADNRRVLSRIRNNVVFHYPGRRGSKYLRSALTAASDDEGEHGSPTGKIRDARLNFADDFQARMVVNACGGTIEDYESKAAALGELTASLMKFLNHALDEFFVACERRVG